MVNGCFGQPQMPVYCTRMEKDYEKLKVSNSSNQCFNRTGESSRYGGLGNLPIGGVSVGGGTSPYILCNPTGNFGSGIPTQPSSITDACAVLPSSDTTVPDSTYTGASRFPVVNRTTSIVMNNSYTNNTNITVGTLREYVWRKSTGGGNYECIYGMKVTMQNADYNLNAAGNQYFEINDMARRDGAVKLPTLLTLQCLQMLHRPIARVAHLRLYNIVLSQAM